MQSPAPALYCPWPRSFVYHTIAFGAAFTLHCCALRGIWGGATMTIPGGTGTTPRNGTCNYSACSAHRLLS